MDLTLDSKDFTQDQLDFIQKIIDARIQAVSASSTKQPSPPRQFHSQPEIRELIVSNLGYLKLELDYEPFRIQAFYHCFRKLIALRPDDLKLVSDGRIRLEPQINGAIQDWDQCPFFQGADNPRYYYWKTS